MKFVRDTSSVPSDCISPRQLHFLNVSNTTNIQNSYIERFHPQDFTVTAPPCVHKPSYSTLRFYKRSCYVITFQREDLGI